MNLILMQENEISDDHTMAFISERRAHHIREVHRAKKGRVLKVGLLNGMLGTGVVVEVSQEHVVLRLQLETVPPKKLPLTLILGLPRPKMLKRILETAAAMGVPRLVLLNSYRVEKSYWQTPLLNSDRIRACLLAGLEQARDTVLPEVILRREFKPFVEDELPKLSEESLKLTGHPSAIEDCPRACASSVTLAIGPEGGFIEYEIEKFRAAGFAIVTMGARILRVETAVPALLGRLF